MFHERLFQGLRRILLFFALLLTGCRPSSPRADLVFINGVEPDSLDPAAVTGQPESRLVSALFEGLLRFNSAGMPEPGVASSWEVSPSGKVYRFHLRPEATWSDGKPLTAEDFIASWRRSLMPATAAPYSSQFFLIQGAEDFFLGKEHDFSKVGVKALDSQTLEVTLIHPTPYFLELMALWFFVPVRQDLISQWGDDWIRPEHLINNGAYILSTWKINDKILLKKNPRYWDKEHVAFETIEALPLARANSAYNFYATGAADLLIGRIPASLLDQLKTQRDFHAFPFLGTTFLRFNCSKPPFHDPRIRKAFTLAIDRHRITEKITRAGEREAESFVPPGIPGYEPAEGLGYHPEHARRLLAEAGYPQGKGFPLINYLYSEGEISEGIAVELQSMWQKELGVSIILARHEWKTYLTAMNNLDFGIAISNWVGDYLDPNTFLELFTTDSGNNRTGWSSPAYDHILNIAAEERDPTKRFYLLQQAEKLLVHTNVPIAPLFFCVGIELYDAQHLGGIQGNLLDKHPLNSMFPKNPK